MRQDVSWTVLYCGTEALPIVTTLQETGLFSPTQAHRAVFQLWTQLMFPPTRALTSVTSIALMCDTNQCLRVYRWHSQHCHQLTDKGGAMTPAVTDKWPVYPPHGLPHGANWCPLHTILSLLCPSLPPSSYPWAPVQTQLTIVLFTLTPPRYPRPGSCVPCN